MSENDGRDGQRKENEKNSKDETGDGHAAGLLPCTDPGMLDDGDGGPPRGGFAGEVC